MDYLYERISYLKGLAEGLEVDETTKEGKLLLHIIDTLEEFADAIVDLNDEQNDLAEYIDLMDEDLEDVENELFGEFDDEYDDEINYVEIECPNCNEIIYLDENLINEDEDTICPNCNEIIVENDSRDEE